jgi:HEAT repeat protein
MALAEASALKDSRLVSGLMKVAGYHDEQRDYDCRAKWMAVAALARQESPQAVPLLVSLVDHGNQNTRFWARAALARMAGDDFKEDKQAWNKWWVGAGHEAIEAKFLKPYTPPK